MYYGCLVSMYYGCVLVALLGSVSAHIPAAIDDDAPKDLCFQCHDIHDNVKHSDIDCGDPFNWSKNNTYPICTGVCTKYISKINDNYEVSRNCLERADLVPWDGCKKMSIGKMIFTVCHCDGHYCNTAARTLSPEYFNLFPIAGSVVWALYRVSLTY